MAVDAYFFGRTSSVFNSTGSCRFCSVVKLDQLCMAETHLNCTNSAIDFFGSVGLEDLIAFMELIREDI